LCVCQEGEEVFVVGVSSTTEAMHFKKGRQKDKSYKDRNQTKSSVLCTLRIFERESLSFSTEKLESEMIINSMISDAVYV
jgi:hypothetical protein